MKINEYFKIWKNIKIVRLIRICIKHSYKKYISYCLDCNMHLCEECLIEREHFNHYKNNILEVKPYKEELDIMNEIIKDYKVKIGNLRK